MTLDVHRMRENGQPPLTCSTAKEVYCQLAALLPVVEILYLINSLEFTAELTALCSLAPVTDPRPRERGCE